MTDLIGFASRVEVAAAGEQRAMLEEAFRAAHGEKPARLLGGSPELSAWLSLHNPFFRMLEANAYESAAMTLVPEGWHWRVDQGRNAGGACFKINGHEQIFTLANTPALALCAAALKARAVLVSA